MSPLMKLWIGGAFMSLYCVKVTTEAVLLG